MGTPEHRRRRLRKGTGHNGTPGAAGQNRADTTADTTEVHDPARRAAERAAGHRRADPSAATEERDVDRGLRGLIGSGSSQLSVGAALRARDAARPTGADLAEAEAKLVVVRRNWVPREDLPRSGR
jgi:hypothetical protein